MANILDQGKQQQILALGRFGRTLRRIEQETGSRRETVGRYLKKAGIKVRPPGRWGHPDSKAATEVITDPAAMSGYRTMSPWRQLICTVVGQRPGGTAGQGPSQRPMARIEIEIVQGVEKFATTVT